MKKKNIIHTYLCYDGRLYKIGRSVDPIKRFISLKTGNPHIELLAYCVGNYERALHKKFELERFKGEWFNLGEETARKIAGWMRENQDIKYTGDHIIPFGKYKGALVSDMTDSASTNYMKWYCRQVKNIKKERTQTFIHFKLQIEKNQALR